LRPRRAESVALTTPAKKWGCGRLCPHPRPPTARFVLDPDGKRILRKKKMRPVPAMSRQSPVRPGVARASLVARVVRRRWNSPSAQACRR